MSIDYRQLLEKAVWTDADFEKMGWHDAALHAVAFQDNEDTAELLLDLDYIVRWIEPEPPREHYKFIVAPATLVFENVWSLEGQIAAHRTRLEIEDIHRRDAGSEQQEQAGVRPWVVEGHDFELILVATGFRQHFRARPIDAGNRQRLTLAQRGGVSFAQPAGFPD